MAKGAPTPASFKPGQSGNPNGRPKKGWSLAESMREYLSTKDPETKRLRRDSLIEMTHLNALKGDATALKLTWNYLEGMPKQTLNQNVNVNFDKVEVADESE